MAIEPEQMEDPVKIRNLMKNARAKDRLDIVLRCQVRLAQLAGRQYQDQLEREFWTAVHVAEEFATAKNGKTTKLSRTRQKERRVGVVQCLIDWALDSDTTEGFRMLCAAQRPELTGEAIVVRHRGRFDEVVVAGAEGKLRQNGIDPSRVL
ncbi:hypothetical protein [Mesorhizobium sp.]|uniref:hypothetical protein n=1 Tax=Mesorhizobium sp. TaxID=1871066 RepID=UPI000FE46C0A|nr:hypothetical protein [Mesorhizobium sp.]RWL95232.1 MAG: hypothetical protein EOR71_33485 [Mesorhizobium sp.]